MRLETLIAFFCYIWLNHFFIYVKNIIYVVTQINQRFIFNTAPFILF